MVSVWVEKLRAEQIVDFTHLTMDLRQATEYLWVVRWEEVKRGKMRSGGKTALKDKMKWWTESVWCFKKWWCTFPVPHPSLTCCPLYEEIGLDSLCHQQGLSCFSKDFYSFQGKGPLPDFTFCGSGVPLIMKVGSPSALSKGEMMSTLRPLGYVFTQFCF